VLGKRVKERGVLEGKEEWGNRVAGKKSVPGFGRGPGSKVRG